MWRILHFTLGWKEPLWQVTSLFLSDRLRFHFWKLRASVRISYILSPSFRPHLAWLHLGLVVFFLFCKFIYLFMAVLGSGPLRELSLAVASGATLCCNVHGCVLVVVPLLWSVDSGAQGFNICSPLGSVVVHGFSCPWGMCDLPGPGS